MTDCKFHLVESDDPFDPTVEDRFLNASALLLRWFATQRNQDFDPNDDHSGLSATAIQSPVVAPKPRRAKPQVKDYFQ